MDLIERGGERSSRWRRVLLATMVSILVPGLSLASEPPGPAGSATDFSSSVTVRAGEVDAVVTDKNGAPVRGLTASDFTVLLDGISVPIDLFEEVQVPGAKSRIEGVSARVRARSQGGRSSQASAKTSPRYFLIFIDDAFLFPSDRNRLLSRLDEDLASLAPGDRVAVVEYSGARLETRIGWSRSLPAVRAAIARVKQAPARGIERLVEVRRASAAWNSVGLVGYADSHQLAQTVKYSVLAATSAMRRLNPGTGKKILILVTGGWPAQPFFYLSGLSPRSLLGEPGEEPERPGDVLKRRSHSLHNEREKPTTFDSAAVLRALEAKAMGATLPLPVFYPPMGVESGESLFRPLTDTANLLHFTVYAASPMRDETALFDASVNSFGMAEGNLFASFDRELERQSSLFFVAGKTGGRALFRGASYGSLGTAASDYRTYYRLGFKLPAEERAVRHTVRVRVRRPGLRMRARHELVQAPERQGPRAALADALAVGAPLWDRGVALEVGKAQRRSRRVRRVALTISVPWDLVAVKPVAGSSSVVSDFRLLVKVDYGDGTATAAIEIPVHATLPAAPPAGAVFHYTAPIDVHPGPQRIGVAAYDPTVGEVGIAVAQIDLQ